jgi:Protein of unknown function (DUF3300)
VGLLPFSPDIALDQVIVHGEKHMIVTFAKHLLSIALSLLLVIATTPLEAGAQQAGPTGYSGQGVPLSAAELQQLVAPIALYPDSLVAQILAAATFPDQVAFASGWLQQNKNLAGATLMQAVDAQPWDPSVKALTQFPSVLDNAAKNLSWTSALGEAYGTQGADVMTAVQVLRAQAQTAGNLKSGSQITVVQQSPQVIVIQPANPQVVYVPQYNPTVVYGTPYVTPGYSTAAVVTTAVVAFGVGIAVGAMMNNGCCGWGYSSWNCGWHGTTTVVYRGGAYYGNPAWRGSAYGPKGVAHYGTGYNSATGTYARGGTVSNGYGSASAGQAYNPKTGTYARGATTSNAYGTTTAAQAYNPRTGASASTVQNSNAYGSSGASTLSKNGKTAYSQHQTNAYGSTGSVQTSNGAKVYGASGANNSAAVAKTADGNKYAAANGNVYKNTGGGWNQTQGAPNQKSTSSYSTTNTAAARGYGGQQQSSGSSAFGGGGWQSREASARGSASRGGGGSGGRR